MNVSYSFIFFVSFSYHISLCLLVHKTRSCYRNTFFSSHLSHVVLQYFRVKNVFFYTVYTLLEFMQYSRTHEPQVSLEKIVSFTIYLVVFSQFVLPVNALVIFPIVVYIVFEQGNTYITVS